MNTSVEALERKENGGQLTADSYSDRVVVKLRRELGFLMEYLENDDVQEIIVNPDGKVFVDSAGKERELVGMFEATNAGNFLSTVASSLHREITRENPYIDGMLIIDGSRISGQVPPYTRSPCFNIRKHAKYVKPLERFVETGSLTQPHFEQIQCAIKNKRNMVIVGSTASGKTFLAKSLLREMSVLCPHDRILTIEDTPELSVSSRDYASWFTTPTCDMRLMLRRALRATPDRIVIGEVRSGESYQLLKMWNTGHSGGLATIHSDKGALDGLRRMERMCGESPETSGMGTGWIRELIADVVNLLINITNENGVRKVQSLVTIDGLTTDGSTYQTEVFDRT